MKTARDRKHRRGVNKPAAKLARRMLAHKKDLEKIGADSKKGKTLALNPPGSLKSIR